MATSDDQRRGPRRGCSPGLQGEAEGETHASAGLGGERSALNKKKEGKSNSSLLGWFLNFLTPPALSPSLQASHITIDGYESDVEAFDDHWLRRLNADGADGGGE